MYVNEWNSFAYIDYIYLSVCAVARFLQKKSFLQILQCNVLILINRIDNLEELWKCLVAISTKDCVNLQQFKEATKCWITKIQQIQSAEHSDNNVQEKLS